MRTRKAKINKEKISDKELLALIAQTTDDGFFCFSQTAIELTSFSRVANMFDNGLLELHRLSLGMAYTITEKGRATL